jgi:hypothetical protein
VFGMQTGRPDPMEQDDDREHRAVLDAWPTPAQRPDPEADEPLDHAREGEDEPITVRTPTAPPSSKSDPGRR